MINLTKGSSIDLSKSDGETLKKVSFGLNWGKIEKRISGGFFGLGSKTEKESVDLDASCALFNEFNEHIETVCYSQRTGANGAISHSGDDRAGDDSNDDNDNEIISVNLSKIPSNIKTIVFFLNSYQGHQFDKIPYSKIRVLDENNKPLASYNLSAENRFESITTMILGKVIKNGSKWQFITIGEPSLERNISGTVQEIKSSFLN